MGDGFQSVYKRHTPFSIVQYTQPVIDKITVEPRGDLLSYIYFTKTKNGVMVPWDWEDIIEFEWWIGDRKIDRQDVNFIRYIYPMFMARTFSKFNYDSARPMFLPLTFSFCQDVPFPIIALKYDAFEIRLKKGSTFDTSRYAYQCYLNYIFLDEPERLYFALNKQIIPIHTTHKISNGEDIQLYKPIKFIATPTVKITDDFTYSVQVNNQFTRKDEPYSGAELMFHTEYSKQTNYGSDSFPPAPLTANNTFLTTAYGRGVYGVTGSSTYSTNYPWNVSDVSNTTYWQTTIATTKDVLFVTSASSNSTNAWQSTNSTGWKSAPGYGVLRTYIVTASSNVANAWAKPWISDQNFGTDASLDFTIEATSQSANVWKAFDGNVLTNWVSRGDVYASGITGTFFINASSNSATTNVVGAFTGRDTWASRPSYGVYTTAGVYESNQYNAFSITSFHRSANVFAKTTNTYSINLSSSTGNVILAFNGRDNPWVSDINVATYGFSTIVGTYTSNASTNESESWRAFDSNEQTQWSSNPVYVKTFAGSYNVSASSNTTNAYLISDSSISTRWDPGSTYGLVIPAGQYSATAISNAYGYIYTTMNTEPEPWTSNILYGNVLAPGQYIANASSNNLNAWRAFALNNTWTGTSVFGQVRFNQGTYIETFSNGQSTGIYGKSGQWTSNVEYGFSLPSGTYTVSNSFSNASGIYTNTGIWGGRPTSNTEFSWSPNANEFFTTPDIGAHIITSSNNSSNAWKAFNQTQDFDFQVVNAYKTRNPYNPTLSNGINTIITNRTGFDNGSGVITITTSNTQNYSVLPTGTYEIVANSNSGSAWRVSDGNSSTFWTPDDDIYTYNTSGNFPGSRYTITVNFPVNVSDIIQSAGSGYQTAVDIQNSFNVTNTNCSISSLNNSTTISILSLNKVNHTIENLGYDFSGSVNVANYPPTNGSDFRFTTNNVFAYSLGTYTVTANSNPTNAWKAFSIKPIQFRRLQTITGRRFAMTVDTQSGGTHSIRTFDNVSITSYIFFKTFRYIKFDTNIFFYVTRPRSQLISGYFVDANNRRIAAPSVQNNNIIIINGQTDITIEIGDDDSYYESDISDTSPYLEITIPSSVSIDTASIITNIYNNVTRVNTLQDISIINTIIINNNVIKLNLNRIQIDYPPLSAASSNLNSGWYGFFHGQVINTAITCFGGGGSFFDSLDNVVDPPGGSKKGFVPKFEGPLPVILDQTYIEPDMTTYNGDIGDSGKGYSIDMDFGYYVIFNRIKFRAAVLQYDTRSNGIPDENAIQPKLTYTQTPYEDTITVNAYIETGVNEWTRVGHIATPTVVPTIDKTFYKYDYYTDLTYITQEYKAKKIRFMFVCKSPKVDVHLYASVGYHISGTTHYLQFTKSSASRLGTLGTSPLEVTGISTPTKYDSNGPNPYLGLDAGASYTIEFPYKYPLNQLQLNLNGRNDSTYDVYDGDNTYQNLPVNTLNSVSTTTSYIYKFVFTSIYGSDSVGGIDRLQFTNSTYNYGYNSTTGLYTPPLIARIPTYLYFPHAPVTFTSATNIVTSTDDGGPYGGGAARSTVYLELLSLTRYLPFFYFDLVPPVNSVSISTYENGTWSGVRPLVAATPFQIPQIIDGTGNYNTPFKGIRIYINSVPFGSASYTGLVRVYDRGQTQISNLNIFSKPVIRDLGINLVKSSSTTYKCLPVFSTSTNTITASDTSFINRGSGSFFGGPVDQEDYIQVNMSRPAVLTVSPTDFRYDLIPSGDNFIWRLTIRQLLTNKSINFVVKNDNAPLSQVNELLGGSTYSGGVSQGEWVEYTFPKQLTIQSFNYTNPDRAGYASDIRVVYKAGDNTYQNLPGTSNTFRIIVTATQAASGIGTAIIPMGSLIFRTANGRKSINAKSNITNIITSGLDANVRPNGSSTTLFRMKQYNFGNEPTLRGVFPPRTKFHDFEFYGNVYTPYSLQAGTSVIFSSSNIISAWIGSNAENPTDGNKLTAVPTQTFKTNSAIGTFNGSLSPTNLTITGLNTVYPQPKIVIIKTSTPILFYVSTYVISDTNSIFTGRCESSGNFNSGIEFNYDDTEILSTSNLLLINQNIPAGTEIPLRVILSNVNTFDLYFSSNSGTGLSNVNNVYTPIFPGGAYNGFGNCFTTLTRPVGGNPITNYFIQSNTVTSWTANGESASFTEPITYVNLTRPITTPVRLEVLRTSDGFLYPTIDTLVYRDSFNRPVNIGPGTFNNRIPIGNFEANVYNIPRIFNPYNRATHIWSGTFRIHTTRSINRAYVEFEGGSMSIGTVVLTSNAEITISPPINGPFTLSGTNGQIVRKVLLFDNNGLIVPQTSNGIVIYEPGLGGGNYTGPETTSTKRGDWIDLSLPGGGNVYKYDVVSNTMPSGWSLQGFRGSAWSIIEDVPRYYSSNAYSNLIQVTNVGPWEKLRLVVSNTYTGVANIQSINVYSRNLTTPYVQQNVPSTVTESPYVDLTYSFPRTTFLDAGSRTWTGNTNNTFTINFSRPTQIQRFECSNILPFFGLVREEYTTSFNYTTFQNLLQRPVMSVEYTNSIQYSTANSFFMYGFINVFSPTTTFTFSDVPANANVWIGTDPATGAPPQITSSILSNTQSTTGYKRFCLFSPGSTSGMQIIINDKPTNFQDFTGWFTPYPNPVSIRLGLFSNAWGVNVHREFNITGTSNIIPFDNYFIRANVTVTNATIRPRLSNITFYNDRGPINIPGYVGGYGSEWIQLQVPSTFTVNSYSIRGALNSNITLSAGGSESTLRVISQAINSSDSHIQIPNSQNSVYRFQVTETPGSFLRLRNVRLYDTNGFEINPYMTSNTFNSNRKDLGECLTGKYNITSSSGTPESVFDSSSTNYQTGAFYTNGNYSMSSKSITLTTRPIYGEWVQVEFPLPVNANVFSLGVTSNPGRFANVIQFCASSDGFNWITANSTTRTTPVANTFYNFTSVLNAPYRFYRVVVSNLVGTESITEFGKLVLYNSSGRRLNSYYIDDVSDVNTFGGSGTTREQIRVQIPQNKSLKYIILNGGRLPRSINVNSTQTVSGSGVYELSTPINSSVFTININSVDYNQFSSAPAIIEMKLVDVRGKSIIPSLIDNTATYNETSLSTPYTYGTFKCSNVFAFDDNPETSWVAQGVANVYYEFPSSVTVTKYTIVNPSLRSWRAFGQTITEPLATTNTYVLSTPQTVSNIEFRVTDPDVNIVGGLVFYDALGRINPTLRSLTENISSSTIFGGVHTTSNDTVTFNMPTVVTANSYSITGSPFPASWNVYAGSILIDQVTNYYTNTFTESFGIKNPTPGSTYSLVITETQNSSNIGINNFQLYNSDGQFLIPQFTSNTAYSATEYSSEMLGLYEVSASIGDNVENAFDSLRNTVYIGNRIQDAVNHAPNGLVMYYANNAVDGCVDFRTFKTASRGLSPQTPCVWRGPWSGLAAPTVSGSGSATLSGGIVEIRYPGTGSFTISPSVFSTSFRDWIQIRMPSFTVITSYRILGAGVDSITFMGSNDGRIWVNLDISGVLNVVRGIPPSRYMYFRAQFDQVSSTPNIISFDLYNNLGKINSFL